MASPGDFRVNKGTLLTKWQQGRSTHSVDSRTSLNAGDDSAWHHETGLVLRHVWKGNRKKNSGGGIGYKGSDAAVWRWGNLLGQRAPKDRSPCGL